MKNFGAHHLIVGVGLHNLGIAYLLVNDYGNAINCFHKAIVIKKAILQPNDSQIAVSYEI